MDGWSLYLYVACTSRGSQRTRCRFPELGIPFLIELGDTDGIDGCPASRRQKKQGP